MAKKDSGLPLLLLAGGAFLLFSGSSKAKASAAPSLPEPVVSETPITALAKRLATSVRERQYDYDRSLCAEFQRAVGIDSDGIYGPVSAQNLAKYTAAPPALFKGAKGAVLKDIATAAAQAYVRSQQKTGYAPPDAVGASDEDELAGDLTDEDEEGPPPADNSPLPPESAPIELVPYTVSASAAPGPAQSTPRPSNLPAGYDPASARRSARAIAAHLKRAGKANYDRRLFGQWQTAAGLVPDRVYAGGARGALLYFGVSPLDVPPPFFPPFDTRPYVPPEKR